MAELGDTTDPRVLVPGDPVAIAANVVAIGGRGRVLARVGASLGGIDAGEAWQGAAADRFRATFDSQPPRWIAAGDSFAAAAAALSGYADTLTWAQSRAAEAVAEWNDAGDGRDHARYLLDSARAQLGRAGSEVASAIRAATEPAPDRPGLVENILDWRGEFVGGVVDSVESYVDLARRLDPHRLVTDPAGYLSDVADLGIGLEHARTNPAAAIEQSLNLDTWQESPARAVGQLVPDTVAGAVTGGGGLLGRRAAAEALETAAEGAGRRTASLGMPLTEADRAALADYTGSGFREINPALRSGEVDTAIRARVDAVNTALAKLPDYQGTVYRGTDLPQNVLDRYQPGQVVSDEAFFSSSATSERAFKGNVKFEIASHTGKDVREYSMFRYQDEVLFAPDTRFTVIDRTYDAATDTIRIQMEEVTR